MKAKVKNELKEWWDACPSKKLRMVVTIFMVLLAFYFTYELGEGLGKFIYYVLH